MFAENSVDQSNVETIDLGGQEFKGNALALLSEWATRPPFYVLNQGAPQVIVCRYADVQEVFADAETFSSELPRAKGFEQYHKFGNVQFLTQSDGERHARLRRLMMPGFSMARVAQIEESIKAIIEGMLDEIDAGPNEFDAMSQYCARLVVGALLTAMCGLSESQKAILLQFQEIQPTVTSLRPGEEWPADCAAVYKAASAVVEEVIAARREESRSDFVSDLVAARDNEDRLSDKELFDSIFGTFAALATTGRSSVGALYMLYSHPDQRQALQQDPSLLPFAIEECLRIAGNGYFTFPRFATRDTVIGGTPIMKGMVVRPSPMGANLDPTVFPDPLRFDIYRKPRRTMTFGHGPHLCIGNILGRKTLQLAISRFMARFPNARLAQSDFKPEYRGAVGELRMTALPMLKS